jgi:hypothetical protein
MRAMPKWVKQELRANFESALRAGRRAARTEPRATRVTYRTRPRALQIELKNGVTLTVPLKLVPELNGASMRDIRTVEVLGRGGGLHWENLDLDLSVPALVSSVLGRARA